MRLKCQTLDARHNGHITFAYRVQVFGAHQEKVKDFNELRVWCWETFGPSCERDSYRTAKITSGWGWYLDETHYTPYIYLAHGQPETLFRLKWM